MNGKRSSKVFIDFDQKDNSLPVDTGGTYRARLVDDEFVAHIEWRDGGDHRSVSANFWRSFIHAYEERNIDPMPSIFAYLEWHGDMSDPHWALECMTLARPDIVERVKRLLILK
jgi:hypothetical protein